MLVRIERIILTNRSLYIFLFAFLDHQGGIHRDSIVLSRCVRMEDLIHTAHLLWPWAAAKCKGVNPFSCDASAVDPEDSSSFTHSDKDTKMVMQEPSVAQNCQNLLNTAYSTMRTSQRTATGLPRCHVSSVPDEMLLMNPKLVCVIRKYQENGPAFQVVRWQEVKVTLSI